MIPDNEQVPSIFDILKPFSVWLRGIDAVQHSSWNSASAHSCIIFSGVFPETYASFDEKYAYQFELILLSFLNNEIRLISQT